MVSDHDHVKLTDDMDRFECYCELTLFITRLEAATYKKQQNILTPVNPMSKHIKKSKNYC